ncbi:MAG: sulfite exporter TauE/SafE family protein [Xanthomonadales bacterium]|nr:sulfite exporter TauE/SafE family protein [Gammaproteobacteria bacterium]MBT8052850.1 sulfite exporter TauE/SafE family protein [Gammaproteobacteria bacterium]NND55689.1 sulfite exporter TauE/SafE family protein [Xanthomonadales bacterium]NNK50000.1 sulfite exporter TauE/SafE family protein [Xanthomonadales bacterium]
MLLELALIGIAAGYMAGFLGIGGGFVVVPALTYLFMQDPAMAPWAIHMAVATSLGTMLVTSLSSIVAHHRKGAIRWGLVRSLAPGLVVGAVMGAMVADRLDGDTLVRVVGVCAILAGLQLLLARQPEGERSLPGQPGVTVVGFIIGSISSLIGIGGGALTGPWQLWHGVRAQNAVATAAACGYPIAIAGTLAFIVFGFGNRLPAGALGYVHVPAFLGIALTSAIAAPFGVATVHRLPPSTVKRVFGIFLILVGLRMLAGF